MVIIGVTSDAFASREGKSPDQSYAERVKALERFLGARYPGRKYILAKLDDNFGPGIASPEVEAIVVTRETAAKIPIANALREARGYPPLKIEIVEHVLAGDGSPISSTRIRRGEIDSQGNVLKVGARAGVPTPERDNI